MARRLYEHRILAVEGFDVRTRAGPAEFVRLRMPDWVNVVPVTADGHLVLVRQHRWGIDAATLEVPGGVVDPGETPDACAIRELREETGYGGGRVESLGWVWSNPAIQDNRTWSFVARDVRPVGPPQPDEAEEITIELHPLSSLPRLLADGHIRHALVVLALQRFLLEDGEPGRRSR